MSGRAKKSIRNASYMFVASILTTVLTFISRTVFVNVLTNTYLGMDSLFANILSFLSLAELGIGASIGYALYRPIKNGDKEKIKSYMKLFEIFYRRIGIFVLGLGFFITPFLGLIVDEKTENIKYLHVFFVLYVINSGISYFFAYKATIIACDQKQYIITRIDIVYTVLMRLTQIIGLWITKSYFLYLLIQIIATVINNLTVAFVATKQYPLLKEKNVQTLSIEEIKEIRKNVGAIFISKVGNVMSYATDSMIISRFLNLSSVGNLANYNLVGNSLLGLLQKVLGTVTASVADLTVENDLKKTIDLFYRIQFVYVAGYGYCSVCIYVLVQNFIELWIGKQYILNDMIVIVFIVNFYITGIRKAIEVFNSATGNFFPGRYIAFIQGLVNVVVSIILVQFYGVLGVLVGTMVSSIFISFWMEAKMLYKYIFKQSVLRYIYINFIYLVQIIINAIITGYITNLVPGTGVIVFFIKIIICGILSLIIFCLLWSKKSEFRYFEKIGYSYIKSFFKCNDY